MPLHKYVYFRHNVKVIIMIIIVFMSVENNDLRKSCIPKYSACNVIYLCCVVVGCKIEYLERAH